MRGQRHNGNGWTRPDAAGSATAAQPASRRKRESVTVTKVTSVARSQVIGSPFGNRITTPLHSWAGIEFRRRTPSRGTRPTNLNSPTMPSPTCGYIGYKVTNSGAASIPGVLFIIRGRNISRISRGHFSVLQPLIIEAVAKLGLREMAQFHLPLSPVSPSCAKASAGRPALQTFRPSSPDSPRLFVGRPFLNRERGRKVTKACQGRQLGRTDSSKTHPRPSHDRLQSRVATIRANSTYRRIIAQKASKSQFSRDGSDLVSKPIHARGGAEGSPNQNDLSVD